MSFSGVVLGEAFQDLPKHMTTLAQNAAVVTGDLMNRFWAFKAEVDRRVRAITKETEKGQTTKPTTATSILNLFYQSLTQILFSFLFL